MKLSSGISKDLKTQFVLDEDALIRLRGVLDKAAKSLQSDVQVVFRVEREDDRFYETVNIEDVVSDSNIFGKKVTLVSIEIRENKAEIGTQREWVARVIFLAERKWGSRFKDTDEIYIDISTEDKNWALLLADEIEPQVIRTINSSKIPRWPLLGLGMVLVYAIIRLYFFAKEKLSLAEIGIDKSIVGAVVLATVIPVTAYLAFASLRNELSWINKWLGPETVFLWGEEEKKFPEREQTRRNFFWGGVVAFIVSLLASVIAAFM